MNYNILMVEDQKEISSIVRKYLEKEGYTYVLAENGLDALECLANHSFHLILLDVMMPGIDGFEVLKEIRERGMELPVMMLTAREQESDRIKGFDYGADDYIVKPFSPRELMRRIKAVFRRVYHQTDEMVLKIGELKLYCNSQKLMKMEQEIVITSTEFALLQTFMKHPNAVLTREQLIRLSFGYDYDGFDRSIDSHIKRLRQKIEEDQKKPKYLKTKYGAGYVFEGEKL